MVQHRIDAVDLALQHLDDAIALTRFRQTPVSAMHPLHEDQQQWSTLNNRLLSRLETLRAIRIVWGGGAVEGQAPGDAQTTCHSCR
jgi:hypothetical protein